MDQREKLAAGSIGVGVVVLALKTAAFLLTGSVALYSDALESVINVVTAGAALYAIRLSAQPADARHPYGHSKAEYFSAVLEGVLILVAAILILHEAYRGALSPQAIDAPKLGLAVNGLASVLNAVWAYVILRAGRRLRSEALVADGRHLVTDVVTSVGVLAGVGLNILWTGWQVMKTSVGGLMDEAVPPEMAARIRDLISAHADGALEAHDLRTRHAGRMTFIDFHLVVAADLSVACAHEICDRLERALKEEIGDALVTIHVEPEEKAKHQGIVVL